MFKFNLNKKNTNLNSKNVKMLFMGNKRCYSCGGR